MGCIGLVLEVKFLEVFKSQDISECEFFFLWQDEVPASVVQAHLKAVEMAIKEGKSDPIAVGLSQVHVFRL